MMGEETLHVEENTMQGNGDADGKQAPKLLCVGVSSLFHHAGATPGVVKMLGVC